MFWISSSFNKYLLCVILPPLRQNTFLTLFHVFPFSIFFLEILLSSMLQRVQILGVSNIFCANLAQKHTRVLEERRRQTNQPNEPC